MMKQVVLSLLFMLSVPAFSINVITQAKENIKKKQQLEQTVKNLLEEAKKPDMRHKKQIECYMLAAECCKKINEVENEKLYLKQKYDTAKFYSAIRDMFLYIEMADSVGRLPNDKGVIVRENPRKYRDILKPYRGNLLKGGMWYYRNSKIANAYDYFDLYLNTAKSDIFMQDNLLVTDTLLPSTAYLAVFSAQNLKNYDGVIKHAKLAKRAGQKPHLVQEYYANAYEQKSDTAHWVAALGEGLRRYPDHPYFFTHLIDYYVDNAQTEKGLLFCDSLIQQNDTVAIYWYAKSLLLLRLNRDSEVIEACDHCIKLKPDYVNAYYNKGIASLNMAVTYAENACTDVTDPRSKTDREEIRKLYMLAKEPMEKVRQMSPNDVDRWAAPLYRIYLNLNMGDEFDEMDRILNQSKN